jgi:alpha-galactosidase
MSEPLGCVVFGMGKIHVAASLLFLMAFGGHAAAAASQPVLAPTPPMGWNSWNHYACEVSDSVVRTQADAMAASGMRAAGYQYVNIDDCWEGKRDDKGYIHPNDKFPDMKALADYAHAKGLKLGDLFLTGPEDVRRI